MDVNTKTAQADVAREQIVDLFTALCGDPDNAAVAAAADGALRELDRLLAVHCAGSSGRRHACPDGHSAGAS